MLGANSDGKALAGTPARRFTFDAYLHSDNSCSGMVSVGMSGKRRLA